MVFEALVINTDMFFERGTILVRIPEAFFKKMQWDLTENYPEFMDSGNEGGKSRYDYEAFVYSPYGGGSNFGTLFIPQVNQKGLVISMDNRLRKLIWLGSFFQPGIGGDSETKHVNYPSDDMHMEGPSGYGSLKEKQNLLAENLEEAKSKNFIARFKTTDKSSKEGLTWEDRPTSNIISIGDNSFFVTHFSKDEGWEDHVPKLWTTYSMSKDEEGKDSAELKRTDVGNEKEQRMAIAYVDSKESFVTEIKNSKDNKKSRILQQEDKVSIEVNDGDKEYSFTLSSEDGKMNLVVGDNEITIDDEGKLIINLMKEIDLKVEGDILIQPDGVVTIGDKNIGTLAKYKELKKILDKLEKHIHVAPTGPTTGPLETSMSPISPGIMEDKRKMETEKIKSE